jgi:flagellar basal-body rod modification protein FlgD
MSNTISFVTPATTTGSGAAQSAVGLADNFDTFLTILTAQIQNQDPLEPMDSTQFTDQLVQFSGVEQQIKQNQQLETLISATHSSAGAALSGYLGQQAEINSTGAAYTGDPIDWRFAMPKGVVEATITVSDSSGKVVYSRPATAAEMQTGAHDFNWDGKKLDGTEVPKDNPYYIGVVAKDADGGELKAAYSLLATVSGVDLTYGEPALTTSAGVFSYGDILRLTRQ